MALTVARRDILTGKTNRKKSRKLGTIQVPFLLVKGTGAECSALSSRGSVSLFIEVSDLSQ